MDMNRFFIVLALSCFGLHMVGADAQTETTSSVESTEELVVGMYNSKTGHIFLPEGTIGMKWVFWSQDGLSPAFSLVDGNNQSLGCNIVMLDGANDIQGCYFKEQEDGFTYLIIATGDAAQKVARAKEEAALKTETIGELVISLNRSTEEFELRSLETSLGLWEVNTKCAPGTLDVHFTDFDHNYLDCEMQIIKEPTDAYRMVAKHTVAMKAALAKRCAEIQEQQKS